MTTTGRRAAAIISWTIPIAAVTAAIALLVFSLRSYESLKHYLDVFASDGDAEAFTRTMFASLVVSSRITALALTCAAGGLLLVRPSIERAVDSLLADTLGYAIGALGAGIQTLRAETRWHVAALLSIVTLGVVLRLRALGQPINYDEAFTYIQYASRPFFVAWSNYSYPNNHLLHTLLVHVSIQLFGSALWAIRIPAVAAGCATIPLSYTVARRLTGRREALMVAALVSVSEFMITFSVVARGYSILTVLFLLALCCGLDIVVTRSRQPWALFTGLSAAGLFTIPAFLYPYGSLMLWLAWAGRRDPQNSALGPGAIVRSAAWTVVIAAACYGPAVATTGLQGLQYASGSVGSVAAVADIAADVLRGLPATVVIVLAASSALAVIQRWPTVPGILPVALAIFPAIVVPIQGKLAPARAWIYLLPVWFTYAAAGVVDAAGWAASFAPRKATTLAGILAAAFTLAVTFHALTHPPVRYAEWISRSGIYGDTDFDQVADYLKRSLTPQDALVAAFPDEYSLEYYLRIHGAPLAPFKNPPMNPKRLIVLANETQAYPVATVLTMKAADYSYTAKPRLLRAFAYSSLYEVELTRP